MKINPKFAAPCGLHCGVCAIHIAGRDNNKKLKERLVNLYKGNIPGKGTLPGAENLTTNDIKCSGCLSDDPFMHCLQCQIRTCVKERGYEGCHECDEFPCVHIEAFPMAIGKKVILRAVPYRREVGTQKWMEDEEARYVCPECGNKLFRGAASCNQCKTAVDLD
jgi:hypothetical protein